jgi:hypothetical protein
MDAEQLACDLSLAEENNILLEQRITELEALAKDTEPFVFAILKERDTLRIENAALHQICRDAYEVWAGSEGIPEPVYASEAYLLQLLLAMRDEVKKGL